MPGFIAADPTSLQRLVAPLRDMIVQGATGSFSIAKSTDCVLPSPDVQVKYRGAVLELSNTSAVFLEYMS